MKQKKPSLIRAANIIHEHNKINGPAAEITTEQNNILLHLLLKHPVIHNKMTSTWYSSVLPSFIVAL